MMRLRSRIGLYILTGITGLAMSFFIFVSNVTKDSYQLYWSTQAKSLTLPELQELQERFYRERVEHATNRCYRSDTKAVPQVYLHDESQLVYCPVAKIGCTFWKRIFLFLHNDTGNVKAESPFQIPRHFVHYGPRKKTQTLRWSALTEKLIQNYTRFMFGRDPYTRLWSAYLDKFFLPDFWRSFAGVITRGRALVSKVAGKCHNDVTFEEFLKYIVSHPPDSMNEHWQPVKYRCDPCLFKPDIVGKQETFTDDAKYILESIGLQWVLSTFDYDSFVQEELSTLINYNFELLKLSFYQDCSNVHEIALLLWQVFQLNGYLPKTMDAKSALAQIPGELDESTFKKFVLDTYRYASQEERKRWKLQKGEALRNAYSTIPESLKQSIIEVYKDDFEMFGYDTLPPGGEY